MNNINRPIEDGSPSEVNPPTNSAVSEMVKINWDIDRIASDIAALEAVEDLDALMKTLIKRAKRLLNEWAAAPEWGEDKISDCEEEIKKIKSRAKEILDGLLKAKSAKNAEIRELDRKIMQVYDFIADDR